MNSTLYDRTRLRWAWLSLGLAAAIVGLILAGVCLLSGRWAHAAGPYRVNSLGDASDADLSDGMCETIIPGGCTLRAAIEQAQATSSPGVDKILIPITGTITLSGNLPTITEKLVISGPGSGDLTIDGIDSYRHFQIEPGIQVEISGLTLANGKAPSVGSWRGGGAIYNEGILTLNDVTIVGCSAGVGSGGAIYNALGSIAIIQNGSRIGAPEAPNVASWGGGGIFNDGTLAITGTVSYNAADRGGGICNSYAGTATIVGNISHNVANSTSGAHGGGILNYQGMMIIRNSSIAYNHTNGSAGGIDNVVAGILTMTNSTVSSNTANDLGGGIRNYAGTLVLSSNTIANNFADHDHDGGGDGGGIYNWGVYNWDGSLHGVIHTTNNIIANNVDQSGDRDCAYDPVYSGTITSQGYNLVENPGDCVFTGTGDITNTDPLLGPLQDNGGDTLTHAPLPGSPAIDAGSCGGPTTDQRGWPRPIDMPHVANVDDGCDIGAYERVFSLYLPLILK